MDSIQVQRVDARLCRLPLRWPVRLGSVAYETRDYVVLNVTATDGTVGSAVGYTRSTPLLESLRTLATNVPERVSSPYGVMERWSRQFGPGWGAMVRGASLFDICLWDLWAKRMDVPVAQALGGNLPPEIPLMVVAGYFVQDRGVAAVLDEVARFVDDGYRTIKVMLTGNDLDLDRSMLSSVRDVVPSSVALAVDLHGQFRDPSESRAYGEWLAGEGLLFVEDPYPSTYWRQIGDFVSAGHVAVASGEDLALAEEFDDLSAVGVRFLRVDATASGGYSTARRVLGRAGAMAGLSALPHVWPHFHAHLNGLGAPVERLEVIPDYVGAEPLWMLLDSVEEVVGGQWRASGIPGTGLRLSSDAVARHTAEHWSIEP